MPADVCELFLATNDSISFNVALLPALFGPTKTTISSSSKLSVVPSEKVMLSKKRVGRETSPLAVSGFALRGCPEMKLGEISDL